LSAGKPAAAPNLGSDLARVDAHVIQPHEYEVLPELTDEVLARAKIDEGGGRFRARPVETE
jgi:hypothetical protein